MAHYSLNITLESDIIPGGSTTHGALIDKDIVFDDLGFPMIPGRRIKGCLREHAEVLVHFLEKHDCLLPGNPLTPREAFERVFGKPGGGSHMNEVHFPTLFPEHYQELAEHVQYLMEKKNDRILHSRNQVLSCYTSMRYQVRIEDGVAADTTLRNIRCLNQLSPAEPNTRKSLTFSSGIEISDVSIAEWLALFCLEFKQLGSLKTRGFGKISCTLGDLTRKVKNGLQ